MISLQAPDARAVPFGSRCAALDGVRGIAILLVLAYHTLRIEGDGGPQVYIWRFFQESTWCGVDLFFVLSGFLITGILLDSKGREGYFRNFYARRSLRIMPLYYATLIAALVVVPLAASPTRLPTLYAKLIANQIWLWLYLQNYLQSQGAHQLPGFGHFWTLAVEEQFYWLWPVIISLVSRRRLFHLCLILCVGEPVLRFFLLQMGASTWAIRELTFTRADSLMWGALAALVVRDRDLLERLRMPRRILAAAAALALLAMAIPRGFLLYEAPEMVIIGYSLFGLLFSVLILSCATGNGLLARAVSAPALQWFGRYSYAIYIAHPILYLLYDSAVAPKFGLRRFPGAFVCFAVVTSASAVFAWMSWILLESRFLRLKRYFEYRSGAKPRTPAQAGLAAVAEISASS